MKIQRKNRPAISGIISAIFVLAALVAIADWLGFNPFTKQESLVNSQITQNMVNSPNGVQVSGNGNTVNKYFNTIADYVLDIKKSSDTPIVQLDGLFVMHLFFKSTSQNLPSRLCVIVNADTPIVSIVPVGLTFNDSWATTTVPMITALSCFNNLSSEEQIVLKFKQAPKMVSASATTTQLLAF